LLPPERDRLLFESLEQRVLLSADPLPALVVASVNGTLDVPGETDTYTFTIEEPARVVFDSLTNAGQFNWSLAGPTGSLVASRAFNQSDSLELSGNPVLALAPGTYTLTVDANGDTTGAYGFNLLDIEKGTGLAPGDTVQETAAPANQTRIYTFEATAGDRFFLDVTSRSGGDYYWRLLDPFGRQVFGPTAMNAPSQDQSLSLGFTGTYTLLVEGRIQQSGTASYAFTLHAIDDAVTPLPLNDRIDGTLAHPGQSHVYEFSLSEDGLALFDSFTNSNSFRWTLEGPLGTVVSLRGFAQSDSYEVGGSPVLSLVAGDYRLVVTGTGDTVGDYGFRLLDLGSAQALALGEEAVASLATGRETVVYRLDAEARDRWLFDLVSKSRDTASWRLLDPFGRVVFGPLSVNDLTQTLSFDGSYYLLLEGRVSETQPVEIRLRVVDLAVANPEGYTAQDFDADGLPYVASSSGSTVPAVVAGGPTGNFLRLLPGSVTGTNTVAFTNTHPGVTPARVDVRFDLRITRVSNQGDGIGFAWLNPGVWGNSGSVPQFGEEVNLAGSFGVGFDPQQNSGEVSSNHVSLHFNGAKLAEFNLDTLLPGFRLDDGQFHRARVVIEQAELGSRVSVYLTPAGGAEVAVVEGFFVNAMYAYDGRVAFGARNGGFRADNDLDNIVVDVTAGTPAALPQVVLGATMSGSLATAQQQARYAFTLSEATLAYFDGLTNNGSLNWTLTGPRGTVVSGRSFNSSDSVDLGGNPALALAPGDYVLMVTGATGAHSFRLLDLEAAAALTPGDTVSGVLNPANRTDAYQFEVTAGERFYFDITARAGGGDVYWRLVDPFGRVVFGPSGMNSTSSDVNVTTLAYDGTYTLLIEGRFYTTGTAGYSFNVRPVSDDTAALALNATTTGSIAHPGQRDFYTFTLDEGGRYYFDSLTNNSSLNWTLSGPRGVVVSARAFTGSDSIDGFSLLDLVAGDYVLTVTGNGETTGNYAFRLLAVDAISTAIETATPVSGVLDPAARTDIYNFTAAAGERFYFDITARAGGGDVYWRLLDPFGRAVFGPASMNSTGSDIDVTTLAFDGTYTLFIEGRFYTTGTASYSFNVQPVSDDTAALELNATTNGSIAHPGQRDFYTFTLDAAGRYYFDSLTNNGSLNWTLTGPRGAVVSSRSFTNSDSVDGFSLLDLLAGNYVLTVTGLRDTAANYAFRLLDLDAGSTIIAPGTTISGVLNPASRTDAYKFEAAAGQRFFFDVTARAGGGDIYWRLLDPFGRAVFGPSPMNGTTSDVDVTTLAYDGTYTLLVEGRFYTSGTVSYSFNVQPVSDPELAILPGESSGMDPQWVDGLFGGGLRLNGLQRVETDGLSLPGLDRTATFEALVRVDRFANTWTPLFYLGGGSVNTRSYTVCRRLSRGIAIKNCVTVSRSVWAL
jgi:large repetitive protein